MAVVFLAVGPSDRLTAQETSLTIYRDGRVLVRRTVTTAVPRGASQFTVDLGVRDIDPASVVALDEGVQVTGARLVAGIGLDGSLRRSVGGAVLFRRDGEHGVQYLRAPLLSMDPPAVQVDSGIIYELPGTPVFPPAMVQLQPRFELGLQSERALNALRLMYMSGGLSWSASYSVMLPRGGTGQAAVSGVAQLDNGGAISLSGVEVQLMAGQVRQVAQPARAYRGVNNLQEIAVTSADGMAEEGMTGTHIYTLPGRVDFTPGESRTLALFPRTTAETQQEYVLRNMGYGVMQAWPQPQEDQHPEVGYRVRRPSGTGGSFGAVPLPGGVVRVYEPDSEGRPQLVGESPIGHTPAGRDLRLVTGTAFDITATRTQTAFERVNNRATESAYRVEIQNARAQAVTVVVADQCPIACDLLSSSIPGEKPSAASVSFRVPVPAGGTATLEYRLRARY